MSKLCVICKQKLDIGQDEVTISQVRADGMNKVTRLRQSDVVANVGAIVHAKCRETFTYQKDIGKK